MSKFRSVPQSFKYAYDGVREAILNEPNFRIHLIISIITLIAAVIFRFTKYEWLTLLFTISFVLILELINTSLEAIVDLVSPERKNRAKVAKDVAAAAVLLAAVISIIVGVVLFSSKIIPLLQESSSI